MKPSLHAKWKRCESVVIASWIVLRWPGDNVDTEHARLKSFSAAHGHRSDVSLESHSCSCIITCLQETRGVPLLLWRFDPPTALTPVARSLEVFDAPVWLRVLLRPWPWKTTRLMRCGGQGLLSPPFVADYLQLNISSRWSKERSLLFLFWLWQMLELWVPTGVPVAELKHIDV